MPELIAPVAGEKQETEVRLSPELLDKLVIRLMKQDISERYKQTREVTDEDWKFCEMIDWHPVDELPLKESFVKELEKARKEPIGKPMTLDELDKLMGLK